MTGSSSDRQRTASFLKASLPTDCVLASLRQAVRSALRSGKLQGVRFAQPVGKVVLDLIPTGNGLRPSFAQPVGKVVLVSSDATMWQQASLDACCMSYSHRNRSSFPTSWTARAAIRYTPGRRVVAYQGVCLYGSSILRRPSEPPSSVEAVPQLDTPPVCPSGRHVSRLGQAMDQALARSAAGG